LRGFKKVGPIVSPGADFGYGFPEQGSSLILKPGAGPLFYTFRKKLGIIAVEDVVGLYGTFNA
jgi:hypothetical protein